MNYQKRKTKFIERLNSENMYKIKKGFINSNGKVYDNIRDIHFEKFSDLSGNLGPLVFESSQVKSDNLFADDTHMYIFRSKYDPNIALRIYDDYGSYKYTYHGDDKLVSELQARQKNIKLTDFPTGIVSIENKVIGQEIPLYNDSITLFSYLKENKNIKLPTHYYLEMLKILKELYINGILYLDSHGKNFLINPETEAIKLIDFDLRYISFDKKINSVNDSMIVNLRNSITHLNRICGIIFDDNFEKLSNLDQIEEYIQEENYKLIKK